MSAYIEVTDSSFEADVLQSEVPVLVDFWADWCGPCKMIAPIVEEIAAQNEGRLKVAKANLDDNAASSANYGVRSIPTLLLFKGGVPAGTLIGAVSATELNKFVNEHM